MSQLKILTEEVHCFGCNGAMRAGEHAAHVSNGSGVSEFAHPRCWVSRLTAGLDSFFRLSDEERENVRAERARWITLSATARRVELELKERSRDEQRRTNR